MATTTTTTSSSASTTKQKTEDIPPNQTIYVHNINEKIRKDELRKSLYALFSQYGPILEIIATKKFRMRGQAFIAFKEIGSAAASLRGLQEFMFYGKPLKIQYAKSKSDIVAKIDGSFVARERRKPEEKKRKAEESTKKQSKRHETETARSNQSHPSVISNMETINKILFIQGLPDNANEVMIGDLFSRFPGFKEVRMVPSKKGLAFVEYDNETQASLALTNLQNYKITEQNPLLITYAKH